MTLRNAWNITKHSVTDFFDGSIFKLSASLAFYTIFSLPGLVIIIIWFSGIFYGRAAIEGSIYERIEAYVGHDVAIEIQNTIRAANEGGSGTIATIIGIIALVIGATSVFGEIQDSINRIWRLKAKPKKGFGLLKILFNRLLSFSMIITLGFILLVSLVINGTMDIFLDRLMERFPNLTVVLVYVVNILTSFLITAFIFAAIFKVLPDARIKWKHVRIGACVTAVLFMLGKFAISFYLGNNRLSSAYGTAGAIIVVLMWVYYSSMILYFGAAFTHAYVIHKGSRIYPNKYAVWVQQIEVESESSIRTQPETKKVIEVPEKKESGQTPMQSG